MSDHYRPCPFPLGSIRALVGWLGDGWARGMCYRAYSQFLEDSRADGRATHYCAWAWRTLGRAEAIGRSAAINVSDLDHMDIVTNVLRIQQRMEARGIAILRPFRLPSNPTIRE